MNNKNFLTSFSIFLLLSTFCIYAQSGNAKSLEIGNMWIYRNIEFMLGFPIDTSYDKDIVIRDTVIHGKQYAVIKNNYNQYSYERADSTKIYYFNTIIDSEYVVIDFLHTETPRVEVDTINFWDKTRIEICVSYWSTLQDNTTCYIEGIGETAYGSNSHGGGSFGRNIVSAQLNGVKYGDTVLVGIEHSDPQQLNFSLSQNYPNPFNPNTRINFTIPKSSKVTLCVYALTGEKITELVNQELPSGNYEYEFDGSNLSSGVYFYQLNADNFIRTKKLVLLK